MTGQELPPPVREVDRTDFDDPATFRRAIAEPCLPAIVRGLVRDWPVVAAAGQSPEALRAYLARFASPARGEAFIADAAIAGRYDYTPGLDGFNFQRLEIDLIDALDRILANAASPASSTLYLGSVETAIFLPGFAEDNRLPAIPPSIGPRIWLGNASHVPCHNDTYDNIACVATGHRTFTLYPPDAVGDLYIGPIDNTMSGRAVSLAPSPPGQDPRFPRFPRAAARAQVARLAPGDALYLPKLWWHQVEATEPINILVNYWWDAFSTGPDAPQTAMMLAMIAIAERPPAERKAWQALFDHYVFRPDGHPLAHVPEEKHGILGPLADNYGRIRAMVMKMLRGG